MRSVELVDAVEEFGFLVALVEEIGERVTLAEDGQPAGVLLPAAELEHWTRQACGALIPLPDTAEERPL